MNSYINCMLALLALINPISKIFLLSSLSEKAGAHEIKKISLMASFVAAMILLLFALIGNPLLQYVFHVKIYALQIVGGFVLFYRGFLALNRGIFFEVEARQRLEDASIVPLASPMIAGPATITAAVSFPAHYGMPETLVAILVGILINLAVMLSARNINRVLKKHNLIGALIRITGLVVAAIGVQMFLDGVGEYIRTFGW